MILAFFLCSALNFYIEPVVYRATLDTYNQQLADLSARIAAEQRTLDSLLASGRNPPRAAELEKQLTDEKSILDDHTQLQEIMSREGCYYIEFEIEIPYQELTYREVNKKILSDFTIVFKLSTQTRSDSLIDTLYYQYSISSFSEAVKTEPSFIEQFGMFIPAGVSDYSVEVLCAENQGQKTGTIEIQKDDYSLMSDLLIASNISTDTAGTYFNKGGLKVVPRASKVFNDLYANLFAYYELYDLPSDSTPVRAAYELVNTDGKVIRRSTQQLDKIARTISANFGISLLGIKAGDYQFRVEVRDSSAGRSALRSVPVKIIRKVLTEVSFEGLPYYEEIEYFVTPDEYRRFKGFTSEGKATYLKKLWKQLNYPVTAQRFEYADANYQQGGKPGRKTDRGRVYIKYGPADEVQKTPIEIQESRPYEQWAYYNGIQFIFVDIRGTNEYTLIWTNARGEKSQPSLYSYLPKSIREQIENDKVPVFDQ